MLNLQKIVVVAANNVGTLSVEQVAAELTQKANDAVDELNNSLDNIEEECWMVVKTETATMQDRNIIMTCTLTLELQPQE